MNTLTSRSARALLAAVVFAPLTLACGAQPVSEGLEEPISVRDGQFVEGELPGEPPLTVEEVLDSKKPVSPTPTSAESSRYFLPFNVAGGVFTGRASTDSVSVGVRLQGLGSGYWVVPVKAVDSLNNNELTWDITTDFHSAPPGKHTLLVAALDADGNSGTQYAASLCVESPVPDNHNACDPKLAPPAVAASLSWDAAVDLDLRIVNPEGTVADWNNPNTALPAEDGKLDLSAPGVGIFDIDSNKDCVIEGRQRENLVWQTTPRSGLYKVYVSLKNACGKDSTRFTFTLNTPTDGAEPDTYDVEESMKVSGIVLAAEANSQNGLGTFVTEFLVP